MAAGVPLWAVLADWTDRLRGVFDRTSDRVGSWTLVAVFAALTASMASFLDFVMHRGCGAPPNIVRVELAFSGAHFRTLLLGGTPEAVCRANVVESLFWDCAFPLAYAPLCVVLYLWAERWRRRSVTGRRDTPAARSRWRDVLVLAPMLAGALDLCENAGLAVAAAALPSHITSPLPPIVGVAVFVSSTASAAKWLWLLFASTGIGAELVAGARALRVSEH